jgi:hypothetical protein
VGLPCFIIKLFQQEDLWVKAENFPFVRRGQCIALFENSAHGCLPILPMLPSLSERDKLHD